MFPSARSAHTPSVIPDALHLQNIKHAHLGSPTSSSLYHPHHPHHQRHTHDEPIHDDDGDTDWIVENEYVDLGVPDPQLTPPTPREPYPMRPLPERRPSEDIEFGNRLPVWAQRSRRGLGARKPWEVSMKLPRSVSRGKMLLLKTLRKTSGHGVVGVVRSPLGSINRSPAGGSAHGHGMKNRTGTPTFEFRDPQQPPESIRMQYTELAPSDGSQSSGSPKREEATKVGGMLAVPDADTARRRMMERERTSSMASTIHPPTITDPRRRSLHSRRSGETMTGATTAQHTVFSHDGSAAVAHSIPLNPRNASSRSNSTSTSSSGALVAQVHSRMLGQRHKNRAALAATPAAPTVTNQAALAKAKKREMKLGNHKSDLTRASAPVLKAWNAFARLPWVAEPEHLPGALMPEESEPRVTADFIPSRNGRGRDKVRGLVSGNPQATAADAIYNAMRAREIAAGENGASTATGQDEDASSQSWYKPRARPRSTNYTVGSTPKGRPKSGLGAGGMKQAYRAYRAAAAGTGGRPLGYMYASPSSITPTSSASAGRSAQAVANASVMGANAGQAYANSITIPRSPQRVARSISSSASKPSAAAASAYLSRSASLSASSPSGQRQQQHRPNAAYFWNGQTYVRAMPVGTSPALPPIPAASLSTSRSYDGQGLPAVPTIPSILSSSSGSANSSATSTMKLSHSLSHDSHSPCRSKSQMASNYAYVATTSPAHHSQRSPLSQTQHHQSNYSGYGGYGGYGYASHPGPVLPYSSPHSHSHSHSHSYSQSSSSTASSATMSSLGRGESVSSGGPGYTTGSPYVRTGAAPSASAYDPGYGYGDKGRYGGVQGPVRYETYQHAYVPNAR